MLAFGLPGYVSIDETGLDSGNSSSNAPGRGTLSADGRYQVFASHSSDLVAGVTDDNFTVDVFLRDLVANTTTLVSHAAGSLITAANSASDGPVISSDGNWVAFRSNATNLAAPDTNSNADIYVWERATGQISLVSVNSAGTNGNDGFADQPAISGDGNIVAYRSTGANLLPLDTDGGFDVFVRNRATSTTLLMSVNSAGTAGGNSSSDHPVVSDDGRTVAFRSFASDLVAGVIDNNNAQDIFVRDVDGTTTTLVGTEIAGVLSGNADSTSSRNSISADGRYQVFVSDATNLSTTDFNGSQDVFLRDLVDGTTTLISHAAGSTASANDISDQPVISADGHWVAFRSYARNLVSNVTGSNSGNIFIWHRDTDTIALVSQNSDLEIVYPDNSSLLPVISAGGEFVAYQSNSSNIAGLDENFNYDIFLWNRLTDTNTLVSATSAGASGNSNSDSVVISADGSTVAFRSFASDLDDSLSDNNGAADVFIYQAGSVRLISRELAGAASGNSDSRTAQRSVSADGQYEVFASYATNLAVEDKNGASDIFLRDLVAGTTTLISHAAGSNATADGDSFQPVISANGEWVVFQSFASDLISGISGGNSGNLFLWNRLTGAKTLITHSTSSTTTYADSTSLGAVISANGDFVAYDSFSSDLAAPDGDFDQDVFVWERATNANTLVSVNSAGDDSGNGESFNASISDDGSAIAFHSTASDLDGAVTDINGVQDVFLRTGIGTPAPDATRLISRGLSGSGSGNNRSVLDEATAYSSVSADGHYAVFVSEATDLVPGFVDDNFTFGADVYLRDLVTGATTLVSHIPGAGNENVGGDGGSDQPVISADGNVVAFRSWSTTLDGDGGADDFGDNIYVWNRLTGEVTLVSVSVTGTGGNDESELPTISDDGTFVAFRSFANDLHPLDTNFSADIFLRDINLGTTTLISVNETGDNGGNDSSDGPRISADGTAITFTSLASDLDPSVGDSNNEQDVFLWRAGIPGPPQNRVRLITRGQGGDTGNRQSFTARHSVSADGRFEVFTSEATDLIAGFVDTNFSFGGDIFLRDLDKDGDGVFNEPNDSETFLVSHAIGSSVEGGDGPSNQPVISGDGRWVAFRSFSTNLHPDAINFTANIFLWDRLNPAASPILVSVNGAGTGSGNGSSESPSISSNGDVVAFVSFANDLDTAFLGETNSDQFVGDVYARSGLTTPAPDVTRLMSVNSAGTNSGNRDSYGPIVSGDGTTVTFLSEAFDLDGLVLDRNGFAFGGGTDVFVRSVTAGPTINPKLVSTSLDAPASGNRYSETNRRSLSIDGRYEVFTSDAADLVANDLNGASDIFLRDNQTGSLYLVSHAFGSTTASGDGFSYQPQISGDGNWVVFSSNAGNLLDPGGLVSDFNFQIDVFLWQRPVSPAIPGAITLVSVNSSGTASAAGLSQSPGISDNGQRIVFQSTAIDLATPDTNSNNDIFVRDLTAAPVTRLISVNTANNNGGNGLSAQPVISGDGSRVAFSSDATNLVAGDTNDQSDVFARRADGLGPVTLISVDSGGGPANGFSVLPDISRDGNLIVFESEASDLDASVLDANNVRDVFVRDLTVAPITRLLSVDPTQLASANGESGGAMISAASGHVVFSSFADNIVAADTNSASDVFVRHATGGGIERVSVSSSGFGGADLSASGFAVISDDGQRVVFGSSARLAALDTNGDYDVYLRDRADDTTTLISVNSAGTNGGNDYSDLPNISGDGSTVAWISYATDLDSTVLDLNDVQDVFVRRLTPTPVTVLASRRLAGAIFSANASADSPSISSNGSRVVYRSDSSDAAPNDGNFSSDVFLYDGIANTLVSVNIFGGSGGGYSDEPVISANGLFVAFRSFAEDLDFFAFDFNGDSDVFRRDLAGGFTELVSVSISFETGDGFSDSPAISGDGRYVAFRSGANNLTSIDEESDFDDDIFVRDFGADGGPLTSFVSINTEGLDGGNEDSDLPVISGNGATVVFNSLATDIAPGIVDSNGALDVYARRVLGAPVTVVVSRNVGGGGATSANGLSYQPTISADGLFVAFTSTAGNLTPNDNALNTDVFVYDVAAEVLELVSVSTGGSAGDSDSDSPSISSDGRYVAFRSDANDLDPLVPEFFEFDGDVFRRDLVLGETAMVSVNMFGDNGGNISSDQPVISGDGQVVVFRGFATDLVPAPPTFGLSNIFARDFGLPLPETSLLSINVAGSSGGDGDSDTPAISQDGSTVVFNSFASDLAGALDTNGQEDVFARLLDTDTTVLVSASLGLGGTFSGNNSSDEAVISGNGLFVAFASVSSNLVTGDTNLSEDVLVYDVATETLELVSINSEGTGSGSSSSNQPAISDDGQFIAFRSNASDLAAIDTNSVSDIFRRDLLTDTTVLVSISSDGTAGGNNISDSPVISGDGSIIAFTSFATDLTDVSDNNSGSDVFVRNLGLPTPTTTLISVDSSDTAAGNAGSTTPVLNRNANAAGGIVVFNSYASNLDELAADLNNAQDVFFRGILAGPTTLVSHKAAGEFSGGSSSEGPVISDNGLSVAYSSFATNLAALPDTNFGTDIFRYDAIAEANELVSINSSRTAAGSGFSGNPAISGNGLYVAFDSAADDLSPDDMTPFVIDVFRRGPFGPTAVTDLISTSIDGGSLNNQSFFPSFPSISFDGQRVAFSSRATNLTATPDTNGVYDIFVRLDVGTPEASTVLASVNSDGTAPGNGGSFLPLLSSDGSRIVFYSEASDLDADVDDLNTATDVFARPVTAGPTTLVSVRAEGTFTGNGTSDSPTLSADGRRVAYSSTAPMLVGNDLNGVMDVFVYDRDLGENILVSMNAAGAESGNGGSGEPVISANGRYVAFRSFARNLSTQLPNVNDDIFRRDLLDNSTLLVSVSATGEESFGNSNPAISAEGNIVAFQSFAPAGTFISGAFDSNFTDDIFARDILGGTTALLSRTDSPTVTAGNSNSFNPVVSHAGNTVTFTSLSTNMVTGVTDFNDASDVFAVRGVTITVADVSVVEGDSGVTSLVFTLLLSDASTDTVTVNVATTNGTATTPGDYTAIGPLPPLTITFEPGDTEEQVTVEIQGDLLVEGSETLFLDLSIATNAALARNRAIGTILDDDAAIGGQKFNDTDRDGVADPGEQRLNGWRINLYNNATGLLVDFQDTRDIDLNGDTVIDLLTERGLYRFSGLDAGSYRVEEVPQAGFVQTHPADATIYVNDFESAMGPEWSSSSVSTTPLGGRKFLGQFANNTVNLSLAALPEHQFIEVSFDLFVIQSWDGNDVFFGPDIFDFRLTGSPTPLLRTTFSNLNGINQAYPGTHPGGDNAPRSGAAENNTLGYGSPGDSVYRLTFSVPHTASSIAFSFMGQQLQGVGDESWGVDNVVVKAIDTILDPGEVPYGKYIVPISGGQTILGKNFGNAQFATISITDVSVAEGNSGSVNAVFNVSLSTPSADVVTVHVNTADNTATDADNDYEPISMTLTFNPGEVTKPVIVPVNGDNRFEANQTFFVNLSNATNAPIAAGDAGQGVGTISNDDARPTISIAAGSANEGDALVFQLTLSNSSDEQVTVVANTANGSATTVDNDYTPIAGQTVTFAPGTTTAQVTVQSIEDTKFEADQVFSVVLSGQVNASGVTGSPATGTIINDDEQPTLSIAPVSANEGVALVFQLTLSNPSDQQVTVVANTADGSATAADNDYIPISGQTVTFSPGTTTAQVTVESRVDNKFEPDQTFTVALSGQTNVIGVTGSPATGTIINDDLQPTVSVAPASASEGDAVVFQVTLSNPSDQQVTMLANTANGSATTTDNDYTALVNQPVTFAPGTTTAQVTVQSIEDTKFETDQIFTVALTNVVNANSSVTGSPATGTIVNDEARPGISIDDQSAAEGNAGTFVDLLFNVTLSNPSDETVTVIVNTADGTATLANSDYQQVNRILTFNPGQTSQTTAVRVIGNDVFEADETFFVNLSGQTNSSLADGQGQGTILNDDVAPPGFSISDVQIVEGDAGSSNLVFTVTLSRASTQQVTVDFSTADIEAKGLVVTRLVSGLSNPLYVTAAPVTTTGSLSWSKVPAGPPTFASSSAAPAR
jgi:hypothetical protein